MKPNLLKSKRISKGLLQKKAAEELGLTEKSYNHKENGKTEFKTNEILKISSVLNLTIDDVNEIFFDNSLPNGNRSVISS
ncbi:DNA-binding XRE family transcriptional regulator [Clostridium beijerinckii]|nr:DNA-binding XRE family transcriptional regulator [Clostridium beijerinckii]